MLHSRRRTRVHMLVLAQGAREVSRVHVPKEDPTMESTVKRLSLAVVAYAALSLPSLAAEVADVNVMLNGDQEVPPVTTAARGTGVFKFGDDGSVSGKVTTTGISGNAAHIHEAARGKNGGVIIPLVKDGEDTWSVPAGTKLSAAQAAAYKAGGLYVNVHSDAHKDGEIRGQITP